MAVYEAWIRENLWDEPALQLLATLALIAALLATFGIVRLLRRALKSRYGQHVGEIVEKLAMVPWLVLASYLLVHIWAIPWVFDQALGSVMIDRWTGARQAISAAVLVAAYLLFRAVNRSIDRLRREGAITKHQKEVAYHVSWVGAFGLAALVVLSVWEVTLTNLLIGAGAITAVFGLAARQTVAAMIAGFVLLLARPFRVGDWIEIVSGGGEQNSGIVQDVTLFHTKIRTFNDEHVLVSNDQVTSNRLTNYSRNERLRIDLEVGVDYETDLSRARDVIREAAEGVDRVTDSPSPRVVGKRFGDSAVVLELHFWIDDPDREHAWLAQTAVIEAIDVAFEREGITIPFPQRTHEFREGAVDADGASDPALELD